MPSEPTKPSRNATVDALVGKAKDAISKASYATALELLQQVLQQAPEDREARRLLAQTTEASRRHQAAVDRYANGLEAARQIEEVLRQGDLDTARARLTAAQQAHRQHEALAAVEARLGEEEALAQQLLASDLADKARRLVESGDWQAALETATESQRLAPSSEANEVRDRAQAELDRLAERRHYRDALEEARGDVERLIEARELQRAGQRLLQATDQLGSHPAFDELGARIDKAKVEFRFRQRFEWAERRANEAARLVAEAELSSRRNAYQEAIERLQSAHRLDPSHPEIEGKLESARAARRQQIAEQQRGEALERCLAEVKSHLDALRLEAAEQTILRGTETFGEPRRFAPLSTRLARLREAERSDPTTGALSEAPDPQTETARLRHQRALAAAYSWAQALLYPFRGSGRSVFWAFLGILIALDLLAALPGVGGVFALTSFLVLVVALGRMPTLVRSTLRGGNLLPSRIELSDLRSLSRDLPRCLGLLVLASLPLLALLTTRQWHGSIEAQGSALGWLAAAGLTWLGGAFFIVAGGATEAFGNAQALRPARHLRGLAVRQTEILLTVDGLFVLILLIVLLQAVLVPSVPWLGLPLVRALQAYGLLVTPHLIGVLVRRHRLELSKIYG